MNILIFTALRRELTPLRRYLATVYDNRHDLSVKFVKIPIGNECSRFNFSKFFSEERVDVCINAGTAGALTSDLRPMDVFFPLVLKEKEPGDIVIAVPPELKLKLPQNWKTGALYTSAKPITSSTERNNIVRQYNALAVDMEAGHVARACQIEKTPIFILKVISDTADETTKHKFIENLDIAVEKLCRHLKYLIDGLSDMKGLSL